MTNIISFKNDATLNNELFMGMVLGKFESLLKENDIKKIYLDLRNVKFIAPLVLPKLCCMGVLARRKGIDLEVVVEANSKVKYYLSQANFFNIVKRYNVLTVDEGLTGGEIDHNKLTYAFLCYEKEELLQKYERMYEFSDRIGEKEKLKFCVKTEIMGQTYQTDELDKYSIRKSPVLTVLENLCGDTKTVQDIALTYVELIHNALWYGDKLCFFCVQAGTYRDKYKNENVGIDVSIMDCGVGLYDTFYNKDWENENKSTKTIELQKFLNLKQLHARDFYSTLEMVLFRKDEEIRGIYDVLEGLLEKKELRVIFLNRSMKLDADANVLKRILGGDVQLKEHIKWMKNIGIGFGVDITFDR